MAPPLPELGDVLDVAVLHDLGDNRAVVAIGGSRDKGQNDATYLCERVAPKAFQSARWLVKKERGETAYEVVISLGRGLTCSCPNWPYRGRNKVIPGVCRHVQALLQLGWIVKRKAAEKPL